MPAGRPPTFKDPEALQSKILDYFENPPLKNIIVDGKMIQVPAITITGLALHLGFVDRRSFYDYEGREEYSHIIKKARLEIESNYEFNLQRNNPTGSIFALKNMGWTDKSQIDLESPDGTMSPDGLTPEQRANRIKTLLDKK